jgi:putative ABC transport system ATP-binding protein
MGPSGSGKTTLLFALSGMDSVDSGRVVFDGVELARLSDKALADVRRTKMGFVFQQPTLLKNLNVFDNIILPSVRDGRKTAGRSARGPGR